MPDKRSKFHEFALISILFKGREDWYFCFLKTEKIAHVMALLERQASFGAGSQLQEIATRAAALPGDIAHLAAGEIEAPVVLADIFALLSAVRLANTAGLIHKDTAAILETEYESIAERLMAGSHPSPFVSVEDFTIPKLSIESTSASITDMRMSHSVLERPLLKDINSKGQSERTERILEFIRKQKSVSIKDIAATIKGCSEKTIQRELNGLIQAGLVRRVGERRWSHYTPA
jgi:DeoR-like protein with HTH domain